MYQISFRQDAIASRFRDNNFDALRLIFAWMVVLYHTAVLTAQDQLQWLEVFSGKVAVQGFFVISGFLVTMSYERSTSLRDYAEKRIRRIFPAYVVIILLSAILLFGVSSEVASEYFLNPGFFRYIGWNLLLANFKAPALPGVFESNPEAGFVNGSLWTIKIEIGFYLLAPLVVWLVRRRGYRMVLLGLFLGSVLWRVGFGAWALAGGGEFAAKLAKQLPGQLAFFVGGAWAYYRLLEGKIVSFHWALLGAIAYAVTEGVYFDWLEPLAATAIVSWVALAGPRLPRAARHGDLSYGTYLYHFPIIQVGVTVGLFADSAYAGVAVTVVLVLAASIASWRLIEAPFLRRVRMPMQHGEASR